MQGNCHQCPKRSVWVVSYVSCFLGRSEVLPVLLQESVAVFAPLGSLIPKNILQNFCECGTSEERKALSKNTFPKNISYITVFTMKEYTIMKQCGRKTGKEWTFSFVPGILCCILYNLNHLIVLCS